jgi:MFS family permease
VLAAAALPAFLIGPFAGVFADRWNKRQTMLWMDAIRTGLIIILLLTLYLVTKLAWLDAGVLVITQLATVYSVVMLASVCAQFFMPSRLTLLSDIVPDTDRARAAGLAQVAANLASIIGPTIAAPLLTVFGMQWALVIDAASFGISFLAIRGIHTPPPAPSSKTAQNAPFWQEWRAGIRFAGGHRIVRATIVTCVASVLGGGVFLSLNVFFITQNLHVTTLFIGIVGAAQSLGAILGAIWAAAFSQRVGLQRVFALGFMGMGTNLVVLAHITVLIPALLCYFGIGFSLAALNVTIFPILLRFTPREMVGRVIAIQGPLVMGGQLVGYILGGALASSLNSRIPAALGQMGFNVYGLLYFAAGICIVLCGVYAWRTLQLPGQQESAA